MLLEQIGTVHFAGMARVLLIRHCETTGQSFYSELTERGRQQARDLAAWLAHWDIDRIVSSPYQRALDTIHPFAGASGLTVEVDERLEERRLAGHYFEDQDEWLAAMRRGFEEPSYRFDGGETGAEAQTRGVAAVIALVAAPNRLTAAVSHGQLMTHILGYIDPSFGYESWQAITTPDVFLIEAPTPGRLRYERVWTPHDEERANQAAHP